jgi:hypothetical protein
MNLSESYIKELRNLGVLSYGDFEKLVEEYEPYSDKLSDTDFIAYLVSRAKIEVMSQAFVRQGNPTELNNFLCKSIKGDLDNINKIRTKMDKIVRS